MLDNSGSPRGKPITYLSAWSAILADIFDRAGFQTEVIGFTTRAWRGGQSREKWIADGSPKFPGRLNDLRYIEYKRFSQSFLDSVQSFAAMWREGVLKENIDGEAILYADERLKQVNSIDKSIIVISDGAPVDDSTLASNDGNYLERHLKATIAQMHS